MLVKSDVDGQIYVDNGTRPADDDNDDDDDDDGLLREDTDFKKIFRDGVAERFLGDTVRQPPERLQLESTTTAELMGSLKSITVHLK